MLILTIDDYIIVKSHGHSVLRYIEWAADVYQLYPDSEQPTSKLMSIFAFLWGLLVWPLRSIDYHDNQDERIKAFIAYLNETEEEA